jgi:hypothetical protein
MESDLVQRTTNGSHGHDVRPIGVAPSAAARIEILVDRLHDAHHEGRELVKVLRIRNGQLHTLRQLYRVREQQLELHVLYRQLRRDVLAVLQALVATEVAP